MCSFWAEIFTLRSAVSTSDGIDKLLGDDICVGVGRGGDYVSGGEIGTTGAGNCHNVGYLGQVV